MENYIKDDVTKGVWEMVTMLFQEGLPCYGKTNYTVANNPSPKELRELQGTDYINTDMPSSGTPLRVHPGDRLCK